ncbi:MAG: protease complex subunit PrcB family protein [Synergistales bacterium]|nr:protease complex subunit PrcB family protein [Synergistales bacterium]
MNLFKVAMALCLAVAFTAPASALSGQSVPLAWYGVAFSYYEPGPAQGAWVIADEGDLSLVPPTLRLEAEEALRALEPRETLLFLSAGMRRTGGYRAVVSEVLCDGRRVLVNWGVQGPPPGAMVSQALTHPMSLVRIPAPLSVIELQEVPLPSDE